MFDDLIFEKFEKSENEAYSKTEQALCISYLQTHSSLLRRQSGHQIRLKNQIRQACRKTRQALSFSDLRP